MCRKIVQKEIITNAEISFLKNLFNIKYHNHKKILFMSSAVLLLLFYVSL